MDSNSHFVNNSDLIKIYRVFCSQTNLRIECQRKFAWCIVKKRVARRGRRDSRRAPPGNKSRASRDSQLNLNRGSQHVDSAMQLQVNSSRRASTARWIWAGHFVGDEETRIVKKSKTLKSWAVQWKVMIADWYNTLGLARAMVSFDGNETHLLHICRFTLTWLWIQQDFPVS